MNLILFFLIIFRNEVSADVLLEKDKEVADAIKAYQWFLEGKNETEIKNELQIPSSIKNVHQALDYVIYLTKVGKIKRKTGIEKFESCRIELNSESEFNLFLRSYQGISSSIRSEYLDEWSYDFPERVSCNICLRNENCNDASIRWRNKTNDKNIPFNAFQKKKQQELCHEMAQYAFQQATNGLVEEGGDKSNCPSGSFCFNSNPYWSVVYGYDFKICQEDFLICPRLKETKNFIHPSCYENDEPEKINEKMDWLNSQSKSIINQCNGIPINFKDLDQPVLINCLEGMEAIDQKGLIHLIPQDLKNLKIKASVYQYSTSKGETYSFQATRFQVQKDNLDKRLTEKKLFLDGQRTKLDKNSNKDYEWKTRNFILTKKKESNLSTNEYEKLKAQITDLENEFKNLEEERKTLINQEINKTPQTIQAGNYVKYLKDLRDSSHFNSEKYYYYENGVITSSEIVQDGALSEFPLNEKDQKTLALFIKQKIKNLIITNGRKIDRSSSSVDMLASAWTKDCMDQKLKQLGCETSTLSSEPYCSSCPEKLTQSQLDSGNEIIPVTKAANRRAFYQQRSCMDYREDYSKLSKTLVNDEIKQHVCSKSLKVGNRNFLKKRPSICSDH